MPTPAIVRTIVPVIVGAILSFLATRGITVDGAFNEALTYAFTAVITGVYYVTLLKLESRWPIAGFLLGSTARPTYEGRHRKASTGSTAATSSTPENQQ
ncbi:hypothetical protein OG497_37605 [Streptomyces sp. NBC_01242]|uniref:hypothetical protein n=1 Tax=Streptomyces sp. NBC_01242 TaxID=2903795 RepID=UPI0022547CE1|nr:hypothetical protein [Streptomyces sp. NBC_01242]MCX4799574.1 hypothetical protein [Streptomyces sp. NBC_01242]